MKQFRNRSKVLVAFVIAIFAFSLSSIDVAAIPVRCVDGTTQEASIAAIDAGANPCAQHGGIAGNVETSTGSPQLDKWVQSAIDLLSAAVGLVIVFSLIFAGIQYMTAGGNASQVAAAKNRIGMAILALILYIFAYAGLQWLIPGGIF